MRWNLRKDNCPTSCSCSKSASVTRLRVLVLTMLDSMFFHLLYIHLFRPFLKYKPSTSPLPSHVSPRKLCSQAAGSVSKLLRLYKRSYGLRQICNIAVYICHSACTIHLLNLPEKTARRDVIHGVKHLEEIAEDWLCARRTLSILSVLARKWKIELPEEAATVFTRTDRRFGSFSTADVPSPKHDVVVATPPSNAASPSRVLPAQPRPGQRDDPRPQTQLQQSIYSYRPNTGASVASASMPATSAEGDHSRTQIRHGPVNGSGSMNIPAEPLAPAIPYAPRHTYSSSTSSIGRPVMAANNDPSRQHSGVASETSGTMTRQTSPSTLFGGVEALVDSQDWWLRDQANLAVGFDNWMSVSNDLAGVHTGLVGNLSAGAEMDQMTGTGYYMPPANGNLRGAGGLGDEEWIYH